MFTPKVVIVGAGAAGIAAASRLVANNVCNVTILEAESRIGGRIYTSSFGDGVVELGAQWVHGEDNNVAHSLGNSAQLLGDDSYDITTAHYVLSDGKMLNPDDAADLFTSCIEVAHDEHKLCNSPGSFGKYFNESIKEKLSNKGIDYKTTSAEGFLAWYERFQNSIDGSDSWFETSAAGLQQYRECEGNSLTRWKTGGYKNIFKILMGNNEEQLKKQIIYNKKVKSIVWNQQQAEVICTDGQKLTADHVLVTVSLGVLKETHFDMFSPPLPMQKVNAIQGLAIGTVDKIFIKFPYRWWPLDCPGFSLLWRKNDILHEDQGGWMGEVFGFYSVDDNPLVMCGWVVGSAARHMEQCSDDQVRDSCYQLLKKFLGAHYDIPPPQYILRSKWHINPNFRGSYSHRTVLSDKTNAWASDLSSPLPQPDKPVLMFGGEATHNHFYSTVHGAIETGWREADRLLSYLHKSSRPPHKYSVVIVGAGMAGLGAATTLASAGVGSFVILEAQDRAGGRVSSVAVDNTGQNYIELGAQWIHGENNPVFQLAKQADLLSSVTSDEGQGMYLKPTGEQVPLSVVQEVAGVVGNILEDCCQFVDEPDVPESLGHFLTTKFNEHLESCNDPPEIRKDKLDIFDWHIRFQVIDNSCNHLNTLSAKAWGLYEFCGGADYNNLKQGYSSVVQHLVDNLPSHSIKTNCVVKLVKYSSDVPYATVFCENGEEYVADHVIVTSSLGFLKENVHSLFCPPLSPEKIQVIQDMGYDTINKIFLVYDTQWWPSHFKGIQLIWDSEEKEDQGYQSWLRHVSGFDVVTTLQGVLLGWVGGEAAMQMETQSDQDIAQLCTSVIRKFMNQQDIPAPAHIFRSKWHSNRFIRGGYSHTTNKFDKNNISPGELAKPVYVKKYNSDENAKHPVLLIAGEALHCKYFSTTHGAYLSGAQQAQVIIDYATKDRLV
ncbi:spermine oxidase-like isoform X2 [Macrosteles quadrilineatus]|nr:spermine oxidase-like isoform X2 [Macrosteles quadrilineatus]